MNVIASTYPVARKAHRCDLCWLDIGVGDKYARHAIAGDGALWTWRAHERCDELTSLWVDAFDHDSQGVDRGSFDQVVEDLVEHYGCEIGEIGAKSD